MLTVGGGGMSAVHRAKGTGLKYNVNVWDTSRDIEKQSL